ncbi:MAG: MgtC/SapB family protein [bacterium]|nr:MgtC/SapB family protein [bacterium]
MVEIFSVENLETFWQLFLAVVLGGAIGMERELARKTAGMRTFALVSMGAALFSIVSRANSISALGATNFDPTRIAAQIVTGIGFLGAGLIIFREDKLRGLTTAAGLWVTAGIGMAVGFGLYTIAIFGTVLIIVVLLVFWQVERKLVRRMPHPYDEAADEDN